MACAAVPAAGQCLGGPDPVSAACDEAPPRWAGHAASIGVNVLLGGLTGGVIQWLRGGDIADGFTRGALGGGIVYLGKRVAAERFWGAGLVGRHAAALGASITRNAAFGRPSFETIVLPLGPVHAVLSRQSFGLGQPSVAPGSLEDTQRAGLARSSVPADGPGITIGGFRVSAKLDIAASAWLAYGIAAPELEFDAGESLSSGALVFRAPGWLIKRGDNQLSAGTTNAGVVYVSDVPAFGPNFTGRAIRHERVHVIQEDQIFRLWTDPLEDWLLERAGGGGLNGWIEADMSTELLELMGTLIADRDTRPWELEAVFFARR